MIYHEKSGTIKIQDTHPLVRFKTLVVGEWMQLTDEWGNTLNCRIAVVLDVDSQGVYTYLRINLLNDVPVIVRCFEIPDNNMIGYRIKPVKFDLTFKVA